jgi:hypothetical protein
MASLAPLRVPRENPEWKLCTSVSIIVQSGYHIHQMTDRAHPAEVCVE